MYHKHSVHLRMLRLLLSLPLLLEVAFEDFSDVILLKLFAQLWSRRCFRSLTKSHMSKNVVIIGQTGAGKSSLINMLCPGANAPTSNDTTGCTHVEREYRCDLGDRFSCQVHDTIGLEEGRWGFLWAPKAERRLITYLKKMKSPHLLVYCIPAGRGLLKKSDGRNYQKFKSAVGKNVPVVVVVTHLENFRGPFSSWWSNNVDKLKAVGIPVDTRHACITTLPKADLHILCMEETLYDNSCADVKSLIRHILSKM
ncbi:P-loop containing nucleoside triphosphate hydrolase protein [Suillus fuscotomentosus]|uniref:P-loop containing nucleoside triphosphate hydrolase protein n=1 Tax=Suillus fuscotomentosus TaxID=1912939 RepID=A0AAD4DQ15_9AGAM|nr:P-loop containing nucleoside triphosphate hydrolase protein [Suillus fuscotomentosus]KAG1889062.1 P-loop containing nucleoside triphosphate hydrolase protein [Suillus fuscotomentosus]